LVVPAHPDHGNVRLDLLGGHVLVDVASLGWPTVWHTLVGRPLRCGPLAPALPRAPGLGEEHARRRIEEVIGTEGYRLSFGETVIGNRSAIETPLMEHIRAFVAHEDPGARVAPMVLPGFTDSRWFREAFPDCVAYGFFPQRTMDMFEAMPLIHGADERIPVPDLGLASRFFAELAPKVLG